MAIPRPAHTRSYEVYFPTPNFVYPARLHKIYGLSLNKVFGNPHGLCLSALHWGPQRKPKPSAVCDGESGGTSCFYDLAEWYRHRNLVSEREYRAFLIRCASHVFVYVLRTFK